MKWPQSLSDSLLCEFWNPPQDICRSGWLAFLGSFLAPWAPSVVSADFENVLTVHCFSLDVKFRCFPWWPNTQDPSSQRELEWSLDGNVWDRLRGFYKTATPSKQLKIVNQIPSFFYFESKHYFILKGMHAFSNIFKICESQKSKNFSSHPWPSAYRFPSLEATTPNHFWCVLQSCPTSIKTMWAYSYFLEKEKKLIPQLAFLIKYWFFLRSHIIVPNCLSAC